MNYLTLNLKIFKIEDGESYYILAENEQQAKDYYENSGECLDEETRMDLLEENETTELNECYTIEEVPLDTDCEITINEDEDLLNIVNSYNSVTRDSVNIYTYAKYMIIQSELRCEGMKIPMLIAGSLFY